MLAWNLLDLLVLMLSTGRGTKREVMAEELKENPVTFSEGDCYDMISLSPRVYLDSGHWFRGRVSPWGAKMSSPCVCHIETIRPRGLGEEQNNSRNPLHCVSEPNKLQGTHTPPEAFGQQWSLSGFLEVWGRAAEECQGTFMKKYGG